MFQFSKVSQARARIVVEEISIGSEPHRRFYLLLIASAMIACFGLAANSAAVIIGAMLVSPLMTPIFGIALGMLQGDMKLFGKATLAEVGGAILAIGSAYVAGLIPWTAGVATAEMLARTQPNLIDLLVAVFAGFAGAYALVDERISPALPGVAIATAIVPPLATCGLCLSMGAWSGAGEALLLFLANLVSILTVALLTFSLTGLVRPTHIGTLRGFVRRYGAAVAAFVVLALILTNSLLRIMEWRSLNQNIQKTLVTELAKDYTTDLEEFVHNARQGRIEILATVRSPRILKSRRVAEIQKSLNNSLETPVDLVIRTVLSKDVTPAGSTLHVTTPDLDGRFLTEQVVGLEAKEAWAEQIIRERFENEPGFELTNVDFGQATRGEGLVLAYVNTIRRLTRSEIADLENDLRNRFQDPELKFFLRVNSARLEFSKGPIRVEWTSWRDATDLDIAQFPEYERKIRQSISESLGAFPVHVHFNLEDGVKRVLAEVVGPNPVSPEDAIKVEAELAQEFGVPIELHLWYRNEFVVNSGGYTTYEDLTAPNLDKRGDQLREVFQPEVATREE
jgi:uncharacterized hydrophobic protein (TIGR00271 family)